MSKGKDKQQEKLEGQAQKLRSFADLLDSIESMESKKKFLWKQIYENAVLDRELAHEQLAQAKLEVAQTPTLHVSMGTIMSKYMERMSRANDQIIKLAELLQEEMRKDEEVDPAEIYTQITRQKR